MKTIALKFATAILALTLAVAPPALAKHHHDHQAAAAQGLSGTTLLIVRHAEKPAEGGGPGLTPAGEARARAYADYFRRFRLDGAPVRLDGLIATADSGKSARPRLTLTPLSQATGLPIQQPFADDDVKGLAGWLAQGPPNRTLVIAWHHGKMPKLLADLGADPTALLPGGAWPSDTYDWVIVLRYDRDARLVKAERVAEPADLVR